MDASAFQQVHDSYSGHPVEEASSGNSNVQRGQNELENGISELRKSALEKIEEAKKLLSMTDGKVSQLPLDKIKSFVTSSLQQKVDREKKGLESLAKVDTGSKKTSMGLFELSDSASQKSKHGPVLFTNQDIDGNDLDTFPAAWKNFTVHPRNLQRVMNQRFVLAPAETGCTDLVFTQGFMSVMSYVDMDTNFFPALGGTGGGIWTALAMELHGGSQNTYPRCSLMDPKYGHFVPKQRIMWLLACLGCGKTFHPEDCVKATNTWSPAKKQEVFRHAAGCIRDKDLEARFDEIEKKCDEYAVKNKGHRQCGLLNVQKGLVTALLPSYRDLAVSVTLDFLTKEGQSKTEKNLDKPVDDRDKVRMKVNLASTYHSYNVQRIPAIQKLTGLNDSSTDGGITEWERIYHGRVDLDRESIALKQHTTVNRLFDTATFTSAHPSTFIMETLFLLSSGLCVSGSEGLTAGLVLKSAFKPFIDSFAVQERDKESHHNWMKMMFPSEAGTVLYDSWMTYYMETKNTNRKLTKKKVTCIDKNVTKWLDESRSHHVKNPLDQRRFNTPCYMEDESVTVSVLENVLTPYAYMHKSTHEHTYANMVVGAAGSSDTMGLGSVLGSLFAPVGELRDAFDNHHVFHVVVLTSQNPGRKSQSDYFRDWAPISSQIGRTVHQLVASMGADCSKADAYTKNVNQLFAEEEYPKVKHFSEQVTDVTLKTKVNLKFGTPDGFPVSFSIRSLAWDNRDDLQNLPEYWMQGKVDGELEGRVGKDDSRLSTLDQLKNVMKSIGEPGTAYQTDTEPEDELAKEIQDDKRSIDTSFGFKDTFDAWAVQQKGIWAGIDWICEMMFVDQHGFYYEGGTKKTGSDLKAEALEKWIARGGEETNFARYHDFSKDESKGPCDFARDDPLSMLDAVRMVLKPALDKMPSDTAGWLAAFSRGDFDEVSNTFYTKRADEFGDRRISVPAGGQYA